MLNVVCPGAGLIGLQRPWEGLLLAGLAIGGLAGGLFLTLLAPAMAPWPLTAGLLCVGLLGWGVAQWLCWQRWRVFRQAADPAYLERMTEELDRMLTAGRYGAAKSMLTVALSEHDEAASLLVRQARLLAATGAPDDARRVWRRVRRVDRGGRYRREADEALSSR